ncbi:methyltransferase domain-containing protein [Oscillibacter sp. MSJ-2]|uniref:Methyltransferase domain-containing protein n=1 Tax=Dysosmobacter acutus TaxID=2841504 RepID=A0ABS6FCW1_9FIRM|nr:methyltransferase domain-containing protein [Dysosmobacter acutus]MBU5628125.1 methyltransferase domain-containing protein [Dysosmobacter acutus]
MSLFCCPVCGLPLTRGSSAFRCPRGHSYDIAREGYTHLLIANRKHSADPGDDKGMAAARREFLSMGYYRPLLDALCGLAIRHTGEAPRVLDAGCGEGYYTSGLFHALVQAGKAPVIAGIDISKSILRSAARREKAVEFAVASSYHLPLPDGSVDLLLNCFSPLALEEFTRVVRGGGFFFYVVPAVHHLYEMKQILYDDPYPNEEKETPYPGFTYESIVPVDFTMHLTCQRDIHNLFQMTPYYWKTPKSGAERLLAIDALTTRAGFRIHVFRRN